MRAINLHISLTNSVNVNAQVIIGNLLYKDLRNVQILSKLIYVNLVNIYKPCTLIKQKYYSSMK